jgi:carnitine O-acetyltransferase
VIEIHWSSQDSLTIRSQVLHYTRYGAAQIKKHKTSPDAFAQMVKQLAFQKLYQRPGVCYESCQTRRFQFGRTEVIRAASNESKKWVESMINPSVSVRYFDVSAKTTC